MNWYFAKIVRNYWKFLSAFTALPVFPSRSETSTGQTTYRRWSGSCMGLNPLDRDRRRYTKVQSRYPKGYL